MVPGNQFVEFVPISCGISDRSRESSDLGFAGIDVVGFADKEWLVIRDW